MSGVDVRDHFRVVRSSPESKREVDCANEVVGKAQQGEPDVVSEARRVQVAGYDTEGQVTVDTNHYDDGPNGPGDAPRNGELVQY